MVSARNWSQIMIGPPSYYWGCESVLHGPREYQGWEIWLLKFMDKSFSWNDVKSTESWGSAIPIRPTLTVLFFFSLLENIFFILLSVCLSAYLFLCGVCVFACMPCMAPVCQPESKFQESLLSSHHVCSGNKTQGIQPDSKHLPLPAEPPYQPLNTDSSARSFWNPSKSQRLGWNNSSLVPKRVYVSGTNNL